MMLLELKRLLTCSRPDGHTGGGFGGQWSYIRSWLRSVDEKGITHGLGEMSAGHENFLRNRLKEDLDYEIVVDYE